ncbi:hypothetical protein [Chitinophaga sp. MM2321]|uniref:DUF6630 family protein n=1 Tax=Chitinophaga sp. MM2321 TaxID=3137178 RepID=UPI0032D582EF
MQKQVRSISREDFIWLTDTYGQDSGYSHIDTKESVVHEIFKDKVLIGTSFLNCASYELSFAGPGLHIKKNRLDNYKLHDQAVLIADEMNEEDAVELSLRWDLLIQELKTLEKLRSLGNAREPLAQLYLDIFNEDDAEEQISNLPEIVPPTVMAVWDELQVALQNTGNLAEFEWQDLADTGMFALNELTPLQTMGITLEVPAAEEYEEMIAADDFAKALLDFVNLQLEDYELKVVAVGPSLDEYQTFTCLYMQDHRLANAMLKMEELCLICFF